MVVEGLYERVERLVVDEGVTVVLVEQFAKMALGLADEASIMVNGRIVRRGLPSDMEPELIRSYMGETRPAQSRGSPSRRPDAAKAAVATAEVPTATDPRDEKPTDTSRSEAHAASIPGTASPKPEGPPEGPSGRQPEGHDEGHEKGDEEGPKDDPGPNATLDSSRTIARDRATRTLGGETTRPRPWIDASPGSAQGSNGSAIADGGMSGALWLTPPDDGAEDPWPSGPSPAP
jgi:hypothetical protein